MLTITREARDQILAAMKEQEPGRTAVRVMAQISGLDFTYGMKLIGPEEKNAEDVAIPEDGFDVVMDAKSAEHLEGATLDFEDGILKSGFKFNNPNKPEVPSIGGGPRPDLAGPVAERVQMLIDTELNPAVAAHGGKMSLLGVRDDKAYLTFGGGCHGCGMVDVTLKQGVEARIRELIPEIQEVVDVTDHSTGENPFYR
ncbi:MAG: NifU family protein [Acidobacteriota bacterium]